MPRPRPRRQLCDCLDCAEPAAASSPVTSAIAQQDPPPKSLIICISAAVCCVASGVTSLEQADCPHLDAVCRDGCTGLLAFVDEKHHAAVAPEVQLITANHQEMATAVPLQERFQGMRAALFTDDAGVARSAEATGYALVEVMDAAGSRSWPPPAEVAQRLLAALGWPEGLPLDSQPHPSGAAAAAATAAAEAAPAEVPPPVTWPWREDTPAGLPAADMSVAVLHAGGSQRGGQEVGGDAVMQDAVDALHWADSLVRQLNSFAGFRDGVLLTLVLSPGSAELPLQLHQQQPLMQPVCAYEKGSAAVADFPAVRRPLQSYQFSGRHGVRVDAGRPAIVVQRLPAVIRRDSVATLRLQDIAARGGSGCMLAERLLPELAYKIARAPKYGA